jgi:hypothetical protein
MSKKLAVAMAIGVILTAPALADTDITLTIPSEWPHDFVGWASLVWSWLTPIIEATGVASFVTALLPQGTPGGVWDMVRKVLNFVAANFLNARNVDLNR